MIDQLFEEAFSSLSQVWWAVSLIAGFFIFRDFWLIYLSQKTIRNFDWIMLELKIPKDNIKTPQSMEQVIASMHGSFSFGLSLHDRYVKGEVEPWISLEMVGFAHSVHFYIRGLRRYRNMIESAVFAQYPDAEIVEVQDYMDGLPNILPNENYEVFGTDWKLIKESAYPIQTYRDMEISGRDEEQVVDPIATLAEAMSNLKENELMMLQVLIRPTGTEWRKEAQKVVDELMGTAKDEKKKGIVKSVGEFVGELSVAPFRHPEYASGGDEASPFKSFRFRSPGEENILKAVERKMGKLAYESIVRFLYIDDRKEFTTDNVWAGFGALRQFYTFDMNFFTPNMKTLTLHKKTWKVPIRPIRKILLKRRRRLLFQAYKERAFPSHPRKSFGLDLKEFILSTEEIATIFHPPSTVVRAPKLQPTEFKKGEPPVELPIK